MKRKMLFFSTVLSFIVVLFASCGSDNELDGSLLLETDKLTQDDITLRGGSECCDNISVISELVPADEGCCAMQFTLVDPTGCATMNTTQHSFPTECVSLDNNGDGVIVVTVCCDAEPGDFVRTKVTSPCQPGIVSEDWTDFEDCDVLDCCETLNITTSLSPAGEGCCAYEFNLDDPADCGQMSSVIVSGFDPGCASTVLNLSSNNAVVTVCCEPEPGASITVNTTSDCDPQITYTLSDFPSECNDDPPCCDDISVDFQLSPSAVGCCSGKFTLNDPGGCGATLGDVEVVGFSDCISVNYVGNVVYVTACCAPEDGAYIRVKVNSECDQEIVSSKWKKFPGCSN